MQRDSGALSAWAKFEAGECPSVLAPHQAHDHLLLLLLFSAVLLSVSPFAATMTKRLALAIYRGLLAWSRQNRGVPLQLRSTDVYSCIPESRAFANLDVQDATAAVESLTRIGFRSGKQLQVSFMAS
jgi:hypothetical protein